MFRVLGLRVKGFRDWGSEGLGIMCICICVYMCIYI